MLPVRERLRNQPSRRAIKTSPATKAEALLLVLMVLAAAAGPLLYRVNPDELHYEVMRTGLIGSVLFASGPASGSEHHLAGVTFTESVGEGSG